jgi:hypothetical protein
MKKITTPLNAIAVFNGFLLVIVFYCAYRSVADTALYNAELIRQQEQRQAEIDIYDRQTKLVDELQAAQQVQNSRVDKLLDKWEQQARRQDTLLNNAEKGDRDKR